MIEWNDPSLAVASDDARRRRFRALQSWYRQHHLQLPPGEDKRGIVRGSMLPHDAPRSANFLSPAIHEYVEARVPVVVGEGGTLEQDRLFRNMLSSMPLCFNLFGAFRVFPISAARVLAAATGLDVASLTRVDVEWTPPGDHPLGDRTAFDAYVEYRNSRNDRCFFGVETKYTEPFSQREYRTERYDEVTASPSSGFVTGAADNLVAKHSNQLWRNAMLAVAVRERGGFAEGRVLVMALDGDESARKATDALRANHRAPDALLAAVSLESLVAEAATTETLAEWSEAFETRYLKLPQPA